jgi:hypothetical protein
MHSTTRTTGERTMPDVVLLYDRDCPNVPSTRENLLKAFSRVGATARWREMALTDEATPPGWRGFASPTLLIDGDDVGDAPPGSVAPGCRLYESPSGGLQGSVPVDLIIRSLLATMGQPRPVEAVVERSRPRGKWTGILASLPAIGVALLPKAVCPACWPLYAGFLSAVGFGFLMKTTYLLPLTSVFLLIAVAALGIRARRRRGYGPMVLGIAAVMVVIAGKFIFDSDPAMYCGAFLLVGASVWNAWPRRTSSGPHCPACPPNPPGA